MHLVLLYITKLDKKYQLIAKNYNIKNLDELVVFLINYLNREDASKEKENLENLFIYTKRALDVIAALPIIKSKTINSIIQPLIGFIPFSSFFIIDSLVFFS